MKKTLNQFLAEGVAHRPKFVPDKGRGVMERHPKAQVLDATEFYAVRRAREGATAHEIAGELGRSSKDVTTLHGQARNKGWYVPYEMDVRQKHGDMQERIKKALKTNPNMETSVAHERFAQYADEGGIGKEPFRRLFKKLKSGDTQ